MNWDERTPARRMAERGQQGFSLIELLIVVAIILIIAAIAIPNFLRARISANESSAVSSIRQLSTAEVTYYSSWGTGYSVDLASLGGASPCNAATAAAACLIDPLLSVAPFVKSGYTFNAAGTRAVPAPGGGNILNGFEINGWPNMVQVTGVRSFCGDQTGLIQFVSPSAGPIGVGAGTCGAVPIVAGVSGPISN